MLTLPFLLGLLVLVIAGGLAYWLLVVTEGTYLGPRVVSLLYDWTARRYDRIKNLSFADEARLLGLPLGDILRYMADPAVLDIATGTGRVVAALVHSADFAGPVYGVDRSLGMLREASRVAAGDAAMTQVVYSQQEAGALGFASEAFSAVTCLEALEFMPYPSEALREMRRVLKPDGVILLSNRVGTDAIFFPKRLCGRGRLEARLAELGFADIEMRRWQVHYDLIWARKPAEGAPRSDPTFSEKEST